MLLNTSWSGRYAFNLHRVKLNLVCMECLKIGFVVNTIVIRIKHCSDAIRQMVVSLCACFVFSLNDSFCKFKGND